MPAVAGSRIANDFSLRTGYKLKQTALRVRNPRNKADEWEEKVLKILEKDRTKNGHGEITELHGKQVYRYMKPLYMEKECVMCHSVPEVMPPEVREYIENNYSTDKALGYKEGDLRGGISVIIPITDEFRP
ncbi:MAG: Tll0287-like domain-containing protein [Planctomycetota bacterium]